MRRDVFQPVGDGCSGALGGGGRCGSGHGGGLTRPSRRGAPPEGVVSRHRDVARPGAARSRRPAARGGGGSRAAAPGPREAAGARRARHRGRASRLGAPLGRASAIARPGRTRPTARPRSRHEAVGSGATPRCTTSAAGRGWTPSRATCHFGLGRAPSTCPAPGGWTAGGQAPPGRERRSRPLARPEATMGRAGGYAGDSSGGDGRLAACAPGGVRRPSGRHAGPTRFEPRFSGR